MQNKMKKLFDLFYETSGVCTDTRKIEKDCLFICLKGANFNGNSFAQQALNDGAKFVIVDEKEFQTDERIYFVENALLYLQKLARHHRLKFNIPVIGITGSNGKTSSKELINAVLSSHYSVLATIGNLNNHIGVPLTLLRLTSNHEIAIIEMGANKFKDIEELCEIAEPTHGIITNIGKAHLEGFLNFEGVLKTKKELYDSVAKNKGTLVYNNDDDVLKFNLPKGISTISYGTSSESHIKGELVNLSPFVELKWSTESYQSDTISTQMIGKYNFYNYLAAISFGMCFNVPIEKINSAIANYSPENNRSQVKKTERNTLILDCYNANPTSMKSALESFALINHPDKYIIIGDMLELGEESMKEHQAISDLVKELNLHGTAVGPLFGALSEHSFENRFTSKSEAIAYFEPSSLSHKLILLKGSRGIGLESLETYL